VLGKQIGKGGFSCTDIAGYGNMLDFLFSTDGR
jgi:hypothetical protein